MSEQDTLAAVIAAINAQFSSTRAYDFADPKAKTLTSGHILVTVTRRFVQPSRASGEVPLPGGRAYTRYVGRSASDVYALRSATAAALEAQVLTGDVGPFVFETASDINDEVDGGTTYYVSDDTFTY